MSALPRESYEGPDRRQVEREHCAAADRLLMRLAVLRRAITTGFAAQQPLQIAEESRHDGPS